MIAEFLVLVALPALLAAAAGWDLASFTIPNRLQLALLATFMLFVAASGMTLAVLGWHLVAGLVGLAIGFALFAAGWIGGGDAKLVSATTLWIGFGLMLQYLVYAALLGGGLTLLILALRRYPLPPPLAGTPWIDRLHDPKSGVPYGITLAIAALLVYPETGIFLRFIG